MDFLHDGRPAVVREATWTPPAERAARNCPTAHDFTDDLLALLAHWDVCSKEWIVRQYDHEVQARTVIKPLVGRRDDGPGDASVVLPVRGLDARPGGRLRHQPALRQARPLCDGRLRDRRGGPQLRGRRRRSRRGSRSSTTSAGATPSGPRPSARWSWPREACRDVALAYGTPFISGKDSLNNEYTHEGRSLAIPPTLLISAIGQVPDVRRCVTMDLKEPGNVLLRRWA